MIQAVKGQSEALIYMPLTATNDIYFITGCVKKDFFTALLRIQVFVFITFLKKTYIDRKPPSI